jgi:hypothetical protein
LSWGKNGAAVKNVPISGTLASEDGVSRNDWANAVVLIVNSIAMNTRTILFRHFIGLSILILSMMILETTALCQLG